MPGLAALSHVTCGAEFTGLRIVATQILPVSPARWGSRARAWDALRSAGHSRDGPRVGGTLPAVGTEELGSVGVGGSPVGFSLGAVPKATVE